MRSEKHLKFGADFLPRPTDIQEKEKTKEKQKKKAEHGICLRFAILYLNKAKEMVVYSFYFI